MLRVSWHTRIGEVDREAWDGLAQALEAPILEWEWLRLLEESGSIAARTGWQPCHLTLWDGDRLLAAAALYLKAHSAGEFIFDDLWMEVAARLGIPYYPKLVGMSPVTPVPGYRFLIAPGADEDELTGTLLGEIAKMCRRLKVQGVSFPFADPDWKERLESRGFLTWEHQGFNWHNPGFASFADYLALFDKNQRRNIRRERAKPRQEGILIKAIGGAEITPALLDRMYSLYESHNLQFGPWAAKYLNRAFFLGLHSSYRHRLLLISAFLPDEEEPLAMSFFLFKGKRLYGRYWGASRHIDSLHFDLCYYQAIEWAIEHGIAEFNPGIGTSHKVRRGFRAVPNYSLHRFLDPRLQRVMAANIDTLNRQSWEQIESLNRALPLAEGRTFLPRGEAGAGG